MNRQETKMIIGMLGSVYINEFSKLNDEQMANMLDVWTMLLEDEDANKIATVTKAYLKSSTNAFMPTPAMLINMAYELFTPKGMTEQEIVTRLKEAICNSGYNAKGIYDNLPEEIQSLCSPRQLYDWSQMNVETVDSVVMSLVTRGLQKRMEEKKKYEILPLSIKKQISEINKSLKIESKTKV